jgi:spore coat protein U-like protein
LPLLIVGSIDPGAASAVAPPDREPSGACSVSASPLSFGMYDPTSRSPAVSVGTITYRCRARLAAGIKIGLVGGQPQTTGMRDMVSSSGERLQYLLCLDATCLQPWGDGSNGTGVYFDPDPPIGTDVTISIFGLIPAEQRANWARGYHNSITVIAQF